MLVEFPIGDGTAKTIAVNVDETSLPPGEYELIGDDGAARTIARMDRSLSSSWEQVQSLLTMIHDQLRQLPESPNEVSVELSLKIGGEVGFAIAKGTAEAAITLSATWRKSGSTE